MVSQFKIELKQEYGKTVVSDCYFTSPLKAGFPRTGGEELRVILMMASAGILNGDEHFYNIVCKNGTKADITEQSYTKIFDCNGGMAAKKMNIELESGAMLNFHPCPIIPFHGSCFDSDSEIYLKGDSYFLSSEIFAAGRIAMGERFSFKHYRSKMTVYVDGKPAFMEHNLYEPENHWPGGIFGFDGYTHQGSLYCYVPDERLLDRIYNYTPDNIVTDDTCAGEEAILLGASHAKKGIIVKVLANQAQIIEDVFEELRRLVFDANW